MCLNQHTDYINMSLFRSQIECCTANLCECVEQLQPETSIISILQEDEVCIVCDYYFTSKGNLERERWKDEVNKVGERRRK